MMASEASHKMSTDNVQQGYVKWFIMKKQEHLERDKEMTSLRHENEELKSKAQKATMDHMEAIKSLNSFTQSLQSENKRLQTENSELNEECKETKLELIRVKKELRKGRINTRNYLEWT
eukprot:77491_1